ncbi:MAG TPA: MarR family winged helix-turn-helix transcriptional regulator [Methylococcaceae bacterium]|nr:MarR family winged helix-turn-helix transcriptional regulator [Methylococcaceae bacterium]
MTTELVYSYLERITNLLRADARRAESGGGLIPVQLEVLHYLAICNRYSNTPAAVAEYLGLTKGTVSQTLRVLETRGYLEKIQDTKDRRVVHLHLSATGRDLVATALPPESLKQGIRLLSAESLQQLSQSLREVLQAMQKANRMRSFGVCGTCRHHILLAEDRQHARCNLTGELLSAEDARHICREHDNPP